MEESSPTALLCQRCGMSMRRPEGATASADGVTCECCRLCRDDEWLAQLNIAPKAQIRRRVEVMER